MGGAGVLAQLGTRSEAMRLLLAPRGATGWQRRWRKQRSPTTRAVSACAAR